MMRFEDMRQFAEQNIPCGDSPDEPQLPRGEWCCTNQQCTVREVRIDMKMLFGESVPKAMFCPSCKRKLKFHHFLSTTSVRIEQ